MKIKITLATMVVLSLYACAGHNLYRQGLDAWIGLSSKNLAGSWGPPSSETMAPNGNTILVYEPAAIYYTGIIDSTSYNSAGHVTYAGSGQPDMNSTPPNCTSYFEIDQNRTILNWRTEGDRCVVKR